MATARDPSGPAARAAALVVSMSEELAAAVFAYLVMHAADDYGEAWDWLERLADRWRNVAEKHKLEQLGDDFLPSEAQDLLASLESSLVLASSADETRRALRLDYSELLQRLISVASHGFFEDEIIEPAWVELERRAGHSLERQPIERPPTPTPRWGRRKARARELVALLDATLGDVATVHRELAPDGRKLSAEERARTIEQLEQAAAVTRTLDLEYDTITRADHELARPLYALFRSAQRALVLALSDDPARRRRAMPLKEAQWRAAILNERLTNDLTYEEAWAKVKADVDARNRG
jgi:hypothetical protein